MNNENRYIIEEETETPAEQPAEQPTEQPVEQPAEQPAEQPPMPPVGAHVPPPPYLSGWNQTPPPPAPYLQPRQR